MPISRNVPPPASRRPLVQVESPYAGDVEANEAYARACLRDSLERGEAPFASHLLYTQPGVLVDLDPEERRWGIEAGLAFLHAVDRSVVYVDRGISSGMAQGVHRALDLGRPVEFRTIEGLSPEFIDVLVKLLGYEAQVEGYRVILSKVLWINPSIGPPPIARDTRWWTALRGVCDDTRTTTDRRQVTLRRATEEDRDG